MQELKITPHDKILILAPHADDDSIGCGGILSKYATQTDVILLTDGRYGGSSSPDEIAAIRAQEFTSAMQTAKVHSFKILSIKDRELKNNFTTFKTIDFSNYTYIFIPHRYEQQCDHKMVYPFLMRMNIKKSTIVAGYEVWTPISEPNYFLNIDDCYQNKHYLISCYQSQIKHNDYADCIEGLNRYRGLKAHCKYAESYTLGYFGELKTNYYFWRQLFNIQKSIKGTTTYYILGLRINIRHKS